MIRRATVLDNVQGVTFHWQTGNCRTRHEIRRIRRRATNRLHVNIVSNLLSAAQSPESCSHQNEFQAERFQRSCTTFPTQLTPKNTDA